MDRRDDFLSRFDCVDKAHRRQLHKFIEEQDYDTDIIELELNEGSESNIQVFLRKDLFLTGYFRKIELVLTPQIIPDAVKRLIIEMSEDNKSDDHAGQNHRSENIKFVLLGGFFIFALGFLFHAYRRHQDFSKNSTEASLSSKPMKVAAPYSLP
jgi:hypothetical protein